MKCILSFILGVDGMSYAEQNQKFRSNFPKRERHARFWRAGVEASG